MTDLTGPQIVDVRLANIPLDADIAEVTDDMRDLPNQEGQIDCGAIVRHLAQVDYEGPISMAPHPSRFISSAVSSTSSKELNPQCTRSS